MRRELIKIKQRKMKKERYRNFSKLFTIMLVSTLLLAGCEKKQEIGPDPYAGGKSPFGVAFSTMAPTPASGPAGSEVLFRVKGAKSWENKIQFLVGNELTKIIAITDSTITVKLPDNVSSGIASILIEGQIFFGPRFKVEGSVSIDPNFKVVSGTNGPIFDFATYSQTYLLVGNFSNFDNKATSSLFFNSIASTNIQGELNTTFNKGRGATGPIFSVPRLASGKLIISGNFNTYNTIRSINSVTRINNDGTLDLQTVNVVNLTPEVPANGTDQVPAFNGGFPDQIVVKSFVNKDNKVICVGDLRTYGRIDYSKSTKLTRFYDYTNVKTVAMMNEDGLLDPTYHPTGSGANGSIFDAYLQTDGKIILVGNFTTYDGQPANRIVRIDAKGNYDPTFQSGTGTDRDINTIRYNAVQQKFMLVGNFISYNGKACPGVAMLNADGSYDDKFVLKPFVGGVPNFATVLSSGKVLVSGSFSKYDNVTRPGFLLLNMEGAVPQNFNVAGKFEGELSQVIETTSSLGNPALVLMGFIRRFDDQVVGNIVRVEIRN